MSDRHKLIVHNVEQNFCNHINQPQMEKRYKIYTITDILDENVGKPHSLATDVDVLVVPFVIEICARGYTTINNSCMQQKGRNM